MGLLCPTAQERGCCASFLRAARVADAKVPRILRCGALGGHSPGSGDQPAVRAGNVFGLNDGRVAS